MVVSVAFVSCGLVPGRRLEELLHSRLVEGEGPDKSSQKVVLRPVEKTAKVSEFF